jgi:prefoldin subunit 5
MGAQALPIPFVFHTGRECRSFMELVSACRQNWAEARTLLGARRIGPFFALIGRNDLAQAAEQATAHPDPDLGLDEFLARLPGSQPSPPGLEIGSEEIDLGTAAVGQDRKGTLTIRNTGERLLSGVVRSESCLWLGVEKPGLQEKRFKANAHQQVELEVHVRGKLLRAHTQQQVGELLIESNGGSRRVLVRIRVPVTAFPNGVLRGAQTPRQLAEKARTALQETGRLLQDGSVARWYQSNGWTYPITGPVATGLAAVQQYFEALGVTAPPRVKLRTSEVTLQGIPGRTTRGCLVMETPDRRPVYASAQSDQPWLSIGPVECRGSEAFIPLIVGTVPACAGQTVHAQLTVQANGQQHFKVPVHLCVGPPSVTEVQQRRNTGRFTRPATDTRLPALPSAAGAGPTGGGAPRLAAGLADSPQPRSPWGLALLCLLVLAVLGALGAFYWMVEREDDSPPPSIPPTETPTSRPAPPTAITPPPPTTNTSPPTTSTPPPPTTSTPPPPTTRKPPPTTEPRDTYVEDLVKRLKNRNLDKNREAANELKERDDLSDPRFRRVIPALVEAAERQADDDFRQLSAQLLRQLGAPLKEDVKFLKTALGIRHPDIRKYVFSVLEKEMGGDRKKDAIAVLAEVLQSHDSEIQSEAKRVLKTLGPEARGLAFGELLGSGGDADKKVRALETLYELGPLTSDEIDAAAAVLSDVKRPTWARCFAADLLGRAGPRAAPAVPVLLLVLQDREKSDAAILARAMQTLGQIGEKSKEVGPPLRALAVSHGEEKIRLAALRLLKQLDPMALSTTQLLERWGAEKDKSVREGLLDLLGTRLTMLKREELPDLRPLLRDKDPAIVHIGLGIVQKRKDEAAVTTADLAALLTREEEIELRKEAIAALQAIGPAARKELPNLAQLLVERWGAEKDKSVREALLDLLGAWLMTLKTEELTDLRPLLRHKDPVMVRVGLKIVQKRKDEAAVTAPDLAALLAREADSSEVEEIELRKEAVAALQALGPAAKKALPNLLQLLIERRLEEKDAAIQQVLARLLEAQFADLKPKEIPALCPLLEHEKPEIVQIALGIVKNRKGAAKGVAAEVAALLTPEVRAPARSDPEVRKEAVAALTAIGPAAWEALPKLSRLLLDRQDQEKDAGVRKALAKLLGDRLATLKPEEMTELRPLLKHKDPMMVHIGLGIVQKRKDEAAAVAQDVAAALKREEPDVRQAAEAALQALGSSGRKALIDVFDALDKRDKQERTSLALIVAGIIDYKDKSDMQRLASFLVDGLHPASLRAYGEKTEGQINDVLLKMGQPAADALFLEINPEAKGKDGLAYRKHLYNALRLLGPKCRSKENFDRIKKLRDNEPTRKSLDGKSTLPAYPEVDEAARQAMYAMDPDS